MKPMTTAVRVSLLAWLGLVGCRAPERLDSGDAEVSTPQPVVSVRGGEALAAWHGGNPRNVYVSSVLGTGTLWSAPASLARGFLPEVALSSSGRAFVIYVDEASAVAAKVRNGGVWGSATLLDTRGGGSVAADATGNAIALWSNGNIKASVYSSSSGWGAATTLQSAAFGTVKVAMNEAGQGVAAWCESRTLAPGSILHAAYYDPAAGWGPMQSSGAGCCAGLTDIVTRNVSAAISESGDAFVVGSSNNVCVLRHGSAGWLSSTPAVATTGVIYSGAQAAAGVDGHALIAWFRGPALTGRTISVRAFAPATGWGPVLSGPRSGVGPMGAGYGPTAGTTAGAAVVYQSGNQLSYIPYSQADGSLSAPVDITSNTDSAQAPYYIRSAGNPLVGVQGVTVYARGNAEEIWATRLGI